MYEPYKCNIHENDSEKFKTPNDISKYAYVTLLMLGDSYLPGILTLGYSIRKMGSEIDTIVMVTNDVSNHARELILTIYTKIIDVPYIIPIDGIIKRPLVKRYPHYLKTFTKLNILNLTQYSKVFFLDADSITLKYFDSLFNLEPPAAVYYGSHKMHENNYQPRLKGDRYIWHKKYCQCCDHGKKINNKYTDLINREKENGELVYGITTECMLLKPDTNLYNQIVSELHNKDFAKFVDNKIHGFASDTGYITWKFSGKWTGIDPRFLGRRGYPRIEDLFGVALGGSKPWIKESIKYLDTYPDFKLWYSYYIKMIDKYNLYGKDKILSELYDNIKEYSKSEKHIDMRIVVPVDSTGLMTDAEIYKYYFNKHLKNITIKIITPNTKIHMEKHADITLFLESIKDDYVFLIFNSKYNIFMVNQEFFIYEDLMSKIKKAKHRYQNKADYDFNKIINMYLCKTLESQKFMENIKKKYNDPMKIIYTKFTSIFPILKIKKDYSKFLHTAGSSPYKNTSTIIDTWKTNNLPEIIIICYNYCYNNLHKYVKNFNNIGKNDNIKLYTTKQDIEEIIKLKNSMGFHICPSYMEGYGHYINEGRMVSSIVLTIDAPPMNELIDETSGILIPYTEKIIRKNGSYGYITDETNLLNGIKKMLNLTNEEKDKLRYNAHFKYKEDTLYFDKKMENLCKYLKNILHSNNLVDINL
jgi:Alpha-N-acetylglucosamine transferase